MIGVHSGPIACWIQSASGVHRTNDVRLLGPPAADLSPFLEPIYRDIRLAGRRAVSRDNIRAVQRGICQNTGRNEKSRLKAGFFV